MRGACVRDWILGKVKLKKLKSWYLCFQGTRNEAFDGQGAVSVRRMCKHDLSKRTDGRTGRDATDEVRCPRFFHLTMLLVCASGVDAVVSSCDTVPLPRYIISSRRIGVELSQQRRYQRHSIRPLAWYIFLSSIVTCIMQRKFSFVSIFWVKFILTITLRQWYDLYGLCVSYKATERVGIVSDVPDASYWNDCEFGANFWSSESFKLC